jgi:hypothetical protein
MGQPYEYSALIDWIALHAIDHSIVRGVNVLAPQLAAEVHAAAQSIAARQRMVGRAEQLSAAFGVTADRAG